jgi:hypothetical protein
MSSSRNNDCDRHLANYTLYNSLATTTPGMGTIYRGTAALHYTLFTQCKKEKSSAQSEQESIKSKESMETTIEEPRRASPTPSGSGYEEV